MPELTKMPRNQQASHLPSPSTSPVRDSSHDIPLGDGFTAEEVNSKHTSPQEPWHPPREYRDCEIRDLVVGPQAVTFMGRVANIFDVPHTPKSSQAAAGCLKLCVRDGGGAITVA